MRTATFALLCATFTPSAFGQAMMAAAAPPAPARSAAGAMEARLTHVRGQVEVLDGAGPSAAVRAASRDEVLTRGLRVRVHEGGAAVLAMPNGASLTLREGAHVMLFASPQAPAQGAPPSNITTLLRGAIAVTASPRPDASLVPVATASSTVFLGRSDAVVSAEVGGHITRIAVQRGRLRVRAGTREYLLRAGNGVVEELGRPRMPPRALPGAPEWTEAPPTRVVSGGDPVDVSATWSPRGATAVAHWRVQLARDADFRDIAREERLTGDTTRWSGRRLEPGSWWVRVIPVDADRFEGPASAGAPVQVAAPRMDPGEAPSANARGRRAAVHVPDGFWCGLDGARTTTTRGAIQLVPGRAHTLRCATQPEGPDAREVQIPASQAGLLQHDASMRTVAYGESILSLRLRDAEGADVPYADVRVTADRGVTLEPVREARERGVYNARVAWPANVTRARFRVTVNDSDPFEVELTQDQ